MQLSVFAFGLCVERIPPESGSDAGNYRGVRSTEYTNVIFELSVFMIGEHMRLMLGIGYCQMQATISEAQKSTVFLPKPCCLHKAGSSIQQCLNREVLRLPRSKQPPWHSISLLHYKKSDTSRRLRRRNALT